MMFSRAPGWTPEPGHPSHAGHLPSLGEFAPDPETALRSFHSTVQSHFAAGGGGPSPAARLDSAATLASTFLDDYLADAKAYFDAPPACDLHLHLPRSFPADQAAHHALAPECRGAAAHVPWCGGSGGSDMNETAIAGVPPALAFEASLARALTGQIPPARVALVLRCALVAAACATARDVVAAPDAWSFPHDPVVSLGGPSPEELDVRRVLLLNDILAAAAGMPVTRRLLPAAAALTGRPAVACLGRSRSVSFLATAIPKGGSAAGSTVPPNLRAYLSYVPKPFAMYFSLVPWTSRPSPIVHHAFLLDSLDDAAYFTQAMYPVAMLRVAPEMAAHVANEAGARRAARVRRREDVEGMDMDQEDYDHYETATGAAPKPSALSLALAGAAGSSSSLASLHAADLASMDVDGGGGAAAAAALGATTDSPSARRKRLRVHEQLPE